MKGREIVKTIMDKTGISNAQLAHRLDITIPTMWDRINSKKVKDIPLSTLNEMVRALDYKIVIVPASKQVKDDEYLVTNEKYDPDELLGKKDESK